MNELKEHPQISELMETLEKNDMHKEKRDVEALVDYIGDMENTLTEMLKEMQSMRLEINLIHNSSLRVKCQNLVASTDNKIRQALSVVGKVKDNLIKSAANAVKVFKEKGKEAFKKAFNAMKIPSTLDKLGKLFGKLSKDLAQDSKQLSSMQTELNSAKGHIKNIGRLMVGKEAKESKDKADRGTLNRLGKLFEKLGRGFSSLEKKAYDHADKIRVDKVKQSVKGDLDFIKGSSSAKQTASPE
ncbi:MAG: hypothetical protein IJQ80_07260, partial [Clostridia bacterium]|nr:hypothetical protein [Clostridia bacterium]